MFISPLDNAATKTITIKPKVPDIKALLKLILFCLPKNCLRSSPTSVLQDTERPIIDPPNTHTQIDIPMLSMETSDWA